MANILDFFTSDSGSNPTNIVQTGGLLFSGRAAETNGNSDIYFTQGPGSCTYTISGGTLAIKTGGAFVIAIGYQTAPEKISLNISGNGVVIDARLWLEAGGSTNTSGSSTVNMQGGLLRSDQIYDMVLLTGGFNFSGGTIQPHGYWLVRQQPPAAWRLHWSPNTANETSP